MVEKGIVMTKLEHILIAEGIKIKLAIGREEMVQQLDQE